jgi:glycerol uptake facilitator-like aquaporin
METPTGNQRKPLVALYELMGTATFVYMILVSTGDAIAVPLALFAMIVIFGGITGGHFNPAVTLGVYMSEGTAEKFKENAPMAVLVTLSQLVGALLGMLVAAFSLSANVDGEWTVPAHRVPILAPKDTESEEGAFETGKEGFNEDW